MIQSSIQITLTLSQKQFMLQRKKSNVILGSLLNLLSVKHFHINIKKHLSNSCSNYYNKIHNPIKLFSTTHSNNSSYAIMDRIARGSRAVVGTRGVSTNNDNQSAVNSLNDKRRIPSAIYQTSPRNSSQPYKWKSSPSDHQRTRQPKHLREIVTIVPSKKEVKTDTEISSDKHQNSPDVIIVNPIATNESKCISSSAMKMNSSRIWENSYTGSNYSANECDSTFTLMSYNVLAQSLIESNLYLYKNCSAEDLEWKSRWKLLQHEITNVNPDILMLQEVQEKHYHEDFLPWFKRLNFKGIYKKRTGKKDDGCAIFFSMTKYNLLESVTVEFRQPNTFMDRDNVAVICKLEDVKTRIAFCVSTTHLLFNPRRHDIKLGQMQILLAEIERMAYTGYRRETYCPIILSGDFNALPSSPLINFVSESFINYQGKSSASLTNNRDCYKMLSQELLPPDLGISDNCQHNSVLEIRDQILNNRSLSISQRRSIEYERVHLFHSERYGGGYSGKMWRNQCTGRLSHPLHLKPVYDPKKSQLVTTTIDMRQVDYIMYSQVPGNRHSNTPPQDGRLKLLATHRLPSPSEASVLGSTPSSISPSDHYHLAAKFVLVGYGKK